MSRLFSDEVKQQVYDQQGGKCNMCRKSLPLNQMEADHIRPFSKGGPTVIGNCQMLCESCHEAKTYSER